MIEEEIEIRTSDGVSDGFLYRPQGESRLPGIIHLTDIGGIRPSQYEMARRLAGEGYCVLMPNVFYRTGRPPVFDLPPNPTEEQRRQRFAELTGPLTPEAMARDGVQYVDFLASQPSVSPGAFGVVGYCFTGSMAMRIAAARPDRIGAAAAFHGGGLYSDAPTSPHLVLDRIQARLYFGHAVNDRSMPEEAIEKLRQALEAWGGEFDNEVYEGAYHGWTVPDSPVYNPTQAERAFEKQRELFQKTLK
jgi:carboxymethylenebutenolidase